jgi:hypothetical protein
MFALTLHPQWAFAVAHLDKDNSVWQSPFCLGT